MTPGPIWTDPVYPPEGQVDNLSGVGYIEFDTKMDTTISATDALKYTKSPPETSRVTISNIHWVNDHRIEFCYEGEDLSWSVHMNADAPYCKSAPGYSFGGFRLNGNLTDGNFEDDEKDNGPLAINMASHPRFMKLFAAK